MMRAYGLWMMLALAGCALAEPPATAEAVPEQQAAAALPRGAHVGPRRGWRPIQIDTTGDIAGGFVDQASLRDRDGVRRAWIVLNLKQQIPMPETGGHAQSVAFVADYRCEAREWRPIQGDWYRHINASRLEFSEPPRNSNFRTVEPGTLNDVFLTAACRL